LNSKELLVTFLMLIMIFGSSKGISVPQAEATHVGVSQIGPESLIPWKPRPVLGPQKTLVLLVEFQNVRFRTSISDIESLMNTVDQWFRRASYGKMLIDYSVYESTLTLPSTMGDYGAPASGDQRGDDSRGIEIYFYDALSMIPDQTLSQYNHVVLIHAGNDEAISGNAYDIWSQCDCAGPIAEEDPANEASWVITDASGRITHAFWGVSTFSENEEWPILAHEFTHSLGVSDLYVYGPDGYSESAGVGFWSNMAAGAFLNPPSDIDGWSKYILGWIDAVPIEAQGNYTIHTLDSAEEPKAIMVPIGGGSEYYFITARRKAGTDAGLPSEGVIVFRIDPYREISTAGQELALLSDANPSTPAQCYNYDSSFQELCQGLDAPYSLKGRNYAFTFSSLSVTVVLDDDAFWSQDAHLGFRVDSIRDDAYNLGFAASPELLGINPTETTTTTQPTTPKCVIATAAYGSEMASDVVYLRTVRDQLIGSTSVGKSLAHGFNRFYYSWSPQLAHLIAPSPILRGLFRILLKPIVWIASVAVLVFNLTFDLTRNDGTSSVMSFLVAAILTMSLYVGVPTISATKILRYWKTRGASARSRRILSPRSHRPRTV
jgi:M6 family metalloprotease-like protein